VLADLAVAIADGAECSSDIAVLAEQPALFGPVASDSTVWRLEERLDGGAHRLPTHVGGQHRNEANQVYAWKPVDEPKQHALRLSFTSSSHRRGTLPTPTLGGTPWSSRLQ
jgi:hypothetical protein